MALTCTIMIHVSCEIMPWSLDWQRMKLLISKITSFRVILWRNLANFFESVMIIQDWIPISRGVPVCKMCFTTFWFIWYPVRQLVSLKHVEIVLDMIFKKYIYKQNHIIDFSCSNWIMQCMQNHQYLIVI